MPGASRLVSPLKRRVHGPLVSQVHKLSATSESVGCRRHWGHFWVKLRSATSAVVPAERAGLDSQREPKLLSQQAFRYLDTQRFPESPPSQLPARSHQANFRPLNDRRARVRHRPELVVRPDSPSARMGPRSTRCRAADPPPWRTRRGALAHKVNQYNNENAARRRRFHVLGWVAVGLRGCAGDSHSS